MTFSKEEAQRRFLNENPRFRDYLEGLITLAEINSDIPKEVLEERAVKAYARLEKAKSKRERIDRIAKLRMTPLSLEEIGVLEGITRERVRQLLSKHPDHDKLKRIELTHKQNLVELTCKVCGKHFKVHKFKVSERRHCSRACQKVSREKNSLERRAEINKKSKAYYQLHKNDPEFKKGIKERNDKAKAKRKERLDRIRKEFFLS